MHPRPGSLRIDAHHHLWRYTEAEYGWIDDSIADLRRDFLLADLTRELAGARVDATVAVQARTTVEETAWLLGLAREDNSPIAGVVGWLPMTAHNLPGYLDRFDSDPLLKGLRHVVQGEPAGFLDDTAFNAGIALLKDRGLVYDILIFARQLEESTRFVDRHPAQPFVLDHIAKPRIAAGEIETWAKELRELARRPNVTCKLSGMVTEADPHNWTSEQLKPYFKVALEAFGPQRLMIGTDWPVCTLGISYAAWWNLVEEWIAPLSDSERDDILGGTAVRAYGLEVAAS